MLGDGKAKAASPELKYGLLDGARKEEAEGEFLRTCCALESLHFPFQRLAVENGVVPEIVSVSHGSPSWISPLYQFTFTIHPDPGTSPRRERPAQREGLSGVVA